MSVRVAGWVWDLEMPSGRKFVLMALADAADHDGRNVYPGIPLLSKMTCLSERAVQGHLRELERLGYIEVDGQAPVERADRRPTRYRIRRDRPTTD